MRYDLLKNLEKCKLGIVINPHFIPTDLDVVRTGLGYDTKINNRYWLKLMPNDYGVYVYADLLELNNLVCGIGSDFPIELYHPAEQVWSLINGGVSLEKILKAYTINGMLLSLDNIMLHSLKTGSIANLIVLPKNVNMLKQRINKSLVDVKDRVSLPILSITRGELKYIDPYILNFKK